MFDYFEDSPDELYYGGVRIQCLCYQDDLLKMSGSVEGIGFGNKRIEFEIDTFKNWRFFQT